MSMEDIVVLLSALSGVLSFVLLFLLTILLKKTGKKGDSSSSDNIKSFILDENERLKGYMETHFSVQNKNSLDFSRMASEHLDKMRVASTESSVRMMQEQKETARVIDSSLAKLQKELQLEMEKERQEGINNRKSLEDAISNLTKSVREELERIRGDNEKKLDQIKSTVDEKLQDTLEKRISASFELVTNNLNQLRQALGEINKLSKDVGDLNKLFGNVKSRGVWGEVQVEAILSDMLSPEQYEKNFKPRKSSQEVVEFAIKLPGKEEGSVYIPIDSKFPKEDYERYVDALNQGDMELVQVCLKALGERVRKEASDIRDKYIYPPRTTDFAILFVPTESLYAELLRMPGYAEDIQQKYKVIISGPTTFSALVTSLQMGFRTLQIEKKTQKVWDIFAQIKLQMSRFARDLEQTQKAIGSAEKRIDDVIKRNLMISSKLERIELPEESVKKAELESPEAGNELKVEDDIN